MTGAALETFVPVAFRRRGARRVVADTRATHDTTLLQALARGFYWQRLVDTGVMKSGAAIAHAEGLHPTAVNELMRLTLLAPDIIAKLLAGRQPRSMTLWWFQHNPLPVDWDTQRQLVARFEEEA
ncbi:site-specific recombinase resolvase [Ralstonia solanacearum]|uniref:site-specific recombinase resolvase n=1 Tax=Ralstonia pseudosolanacearum TaxID=1310165 RepID=UPI0006BCB187|nr:site-specific recombinase resolvase [Ralstonia pseudosolanacearum]AKZ27119.1 site-specific recombinase resolvase [Ralstonia solanacearum]AUS40961.1 site-specific recombinase resolvase [Ralstonia solanacearum]MDO3559857.1 site-specific recombinase resolvase [Ralstonia pseudosolanacearum]MDO3572086.1 site-specific recombinase resolvase [Ralstonia pseudosolanacearum]MDO3619309.1 site-specific recombinase resolvase [Ralstonia pseudosolanacearum]